MARKIAIERWQVYWDARNTGTQPVPAAVAAGISRDAAMDFEAGKTTSSGVQLKMDMSGREPGEDSSLNREARRALTDFGFFRLRYFGRYARPWMIDVADKVAAWLDSEGEEYVVVNLPPGTGKSLLFTTDIPLWVICRNRSVRILIGSSTASKATNQTRLIRRELERGAPLHPSAEQRAQGAVDAMTTLSIDFGRFRPEAKELWRQDQFIVEQVGATSVFEKEPTVTAIGEESDFLGLRGDLVLWDDLVTTKTVRSARLREDQREWWDDVASPRLEPHGLLVLQGQRLGADDLYRYCLDKVTPTWSDEDRDEPDGERPQYHHVIYKAHDDAHCEMKHHTPVPGRPHKNDAKPYPEGCLLDPWRLPRKKLLALERNTANYKTLYQQEDVDPGQVLVPKIYINGGDDETGTYPGCLDRQRGRWQLPEGLAGELFSVLSVDPSPTRFWSCQAWVFQRVPVPGQERPFEQRFLMDHVRAKMDAPEFLDRDSHGVYSGLADEWQRRSADCGWPITHWIIEANAAQRFMMQYAFVRDWLMANRVQLIPHTTGRNKANPDYGVSILRPIYRQGLVRLPYLDRGDQAATVQLTDELTRYPEAPTDDCVMSNWFFEHNLDKLFPPKSRIPKARRPSWIGSLGRSYR